MPPKKKAEADEPLIEALEIERKGYVTRGLGQRVAEVDDQLVLAGGKPGPAADHELGAEPPAEPDDPEPAPNGDKPADQSGSGPSF